MGYRLVLLVTVGLLAVWLAPAEDIQGDGMRPQHYGNHHHGKVRPCNLDLGPVKRSARQPKALNRAFSHFLLPQQATLRISLDKLSP
jgi:hypothetical protein